MAERKQNNRAEIESAITEHLLVNGSADWQPVRDRFPEVSDSTFWRYVRTAKKASGVGEAKHSAKKVAKVVQKAKEELGVGITPSVVEARGPENVSMAVDYAAQVMKALGIADKLEAHAMNKDGGIRMPMLLKDSARIRLDSMRTLAQVGEFLDGGRRQEQFFAELMGELAKESPEFQIRVMRRLHQVGMRFGFGAVTGMV
jgi:hypothetical protein